MHPAGSRLQEQGPRPLPGVRTMESLRPTRGLHGECLNIAATIYICVYTHTGTQLTRLPVIPVISISCVRAPVPRVFLAHPPRLRQTHDSCLLLREYIYILYIHVMYARESSALSVLFFFRLSLFSMCALL